MCATVFHDPYIFKIIHVWMRNAFLPFEYSDVPVFYGSQFLYTLITLDSCMYIFSTCYCIRAYPTTFWLNPLTLGVICSPRFDIISSPATKLLGKLMRCQPSLFCPVHLQIVKHLNDTS